MQIYKNTANAQSTRITSRFTLF